MLVGEAEIKRMPSDSSAWNVKYLTTLARAVAAIEAEIRSCIPDDIILKNRANKNEEVKPSDPGYDGLKRRFAAEVSGERSRILLSFLYQFEKYIKHDRSGFVELYAESFKENKSKWDSVLYEFPKLDHTTVSIIFGDISGTAIGYTLDSLSAIGLVAQSSLKPPKPKHVMISSKGMVVIETAIESGSSNFGLLYPAALTQSSVRASR